MQKNQPASLSATPKDYQTTLERLTHCNPYWRFFSPWQLIIKVLSVCRTDLQIKITMTSLEEWRSNHNDEPRGSSFERKWWDRCKIRLCERRARSLMMARWLKFVRVRDWKITHNRCVVQETLYSYRNLTIFVLSITNWHQVTCWHHPTFQYHFVTVVYILVAAHISIWPTHGIKHGCGIENVSATDSR